MPDAAIDLAGSQLPSCGFMLPGYVFAGWNTKADGSGTSYADESNIEGLVSASTGSVALYAQWAPRTYRILFESNGGSGAMGEVTATFDEPVQLPACTFAAPGGKAFVGWRRAGTMGSIYEDGALTNNLCTMNPDGSVNGVVLAATWANQHAPHIVITNDCQPVAFSEYADALSLVALDERGELTGAVYQGFTSLGDGTYELGSVDLPSGLYEVRLEGEDAGGKVLVVSPERAGTVYLDYYTVEIQAGGRAGAWLAREGVVKLNNVLGGTSLAIGASVDNGYVFDGYAAQGCDPKWENDDPSVANQTVTVRGQTVIEVYAAPSSYTISFDANGCIGTMADQAFVYDESQSLAANNFARAGYTFAGWNTKADGSGGAFVDEQNVRNLVADGSAVTLYAQWRPVAYSIEFNGNGNDAGAMPSQALTYDAPQNLANMTMTKAGYHFVGWNTEADGSGATYADGQEVVNLAVEKGAVVTLWAQWERDSYTISFDANGGSGTMADQRAFTKDSLRLSDNAFAREGYTFAGWNTQADGSGATYADGADYTGDLSVAGETIVLYAQWTKNPATRPEPGADSNDKPRPGSNDKPESEQDKKRPVSDAEPKVPALPATGDAFGGVSAGAAALPGIAAVALVAVGLKVRSR